MSPIISQLEPVGNEMPEFFTLHQSRETFRDVPVADDGTILLAQRLFRRLDHYVMAIDCQVLK